MRESRRSKGRRPAEIPRDVVLAYRLETEGRVDEAERLYVEALARDPREPNALHQLGLIHRRRGDLAKALAFMEAAVRADRTSAEALSNLGLVLQDLGRHEAAIDTFNRAVVVDRRNAAAVYNRGNSLTALDRFDEALASYDRALAIEPGHVDALYNRGNALRELRRHDEALASYAGALAVRPDYADVHLNEALTRLRIGDFAGGFAKYEWRWMKPEVAPLRRSFAEPLWLGEAPLAGRTLLLHAEQGFGDTIQFARYAALAAREGAEVVLEVQPALAALMAGLDGASVVVGRGTALPRFDLHCPLLSLPLAFRTEPATIPAAVPYIKVPADRLTQWRDRLPPPAKPLRIGIAWAGSTGYRDDRQRSLGLGRLAPLLARPDVEVVGLQRELRSDDTLPADDGGLLRVGTGFADFADTAAVVSLVDAVVAVDTAVAHLAGALAKPLLVMLPFSPDFRWMLERPDSPWYPTAKLFRQQRRGDWDSVIEPIRRELDRLASQAR